MVNESSGINRMLVGIVAVMKRLIKTGIVIDEFVGYVQRAFI